MIRSLIILIPALLMAAPAFADFNGTWSGQGDLTDPGSKIHCGSGVLKIDQSSTRITVGQSDFECDGGLSLNYSPYTLTVDGMWLYYQDQKVGMIMGDTIDANWSRASSDGTYTWSWHVSVSGNTMTYTETMKMPSSTSVLNATLKR